MYAPGTIPWSASPRALTTTSAPEQVCVRGLSPTLQFSEQGAEEPRERGETGRLARERRLWHQSGVPDPRQSRLYTAAIRRNPILALFPGLDELHFLLRRRLANHTYHLGLRFLFGLDIPVLLRGAPAHIQRSLLASGLFSASAGNLARPPFKTRFSTGN